MYTDLFFIHYFWSELREILKADKFEIVKYLNKLDLKNKKQLGTADAQSITFWHVLLADKSEDNYMNHVVQKLCAPQHISTKHTLFFI